MTTEERGDDETTGARLLSSEFFKIGRKMPGSVAAFLSYERSVSMVLDAAERLSAFTGVPEIEALVIRLDPSEAALMTYDNINQLSYQKLQENEDKIRIEEIERSRVLRLQFDDWLKSRKNNRVSWIEREGNSEIVFESLRTRLNYVVVARPDDSFCLAEHEALLAAIFTSGCPVLVLPRQTNVNFGKIAIAWHDDSDITQFVKNAVSLFSDAKEIHLLFGCSGTCREPLITQDIINNQTKVIQHIVAIDRDNCLGEAILMAAKSLKVDLLVAGATAHNTWHILLFGDVTKVLLHQSGMPLLFYRK